MCPSTARCASTTGRPAPISAGRGPVRSRRTTLTQSRASWTSGVARQPPVSSTSTCNFRRPTAMRFCAATTSGNRRPAAATTNPAGWSRSRWSAPVRLGRRRCQCWPKRSQGRRTPRAGRSILPWSMSMWRWTAAFSSPITTRGCGGFFTPQAIRRKFRRSIRSPGTTLCSAGRRSLRPNGPT